MNDSTVSRDAISIIYEPRYTQAVLSMRLLTHEGLDRTTNVIWVIKNRKWTTSLLLFHWEPYSYLYNFRFPRVSLGLWSNPPSKHWNSVQWFSAPDNDVIVIFIRLKSTAGPYRLMGFRRQFKLDEGKDGRPPNWLPVVGTSLKCPYNRTWASNRKSWKRGKDGIYLL